MTECVTKVIDGIDPKKLFVLAHEWWYFSETDELRREAFYSENADELLFTIKEKKDLFFGVLPIQSKENNLYSLSSGLVSVVKKDESILAIEKFEGNDGIYYWMAFVYKGKMIISSEIYGDYLTIAKNIQQFQELLDNACNPNIEEYDGDADEDTSLLHYVGNGISDFVFNSMGNPEKGESLSKFLPKAEFKKFRYLRDINREKNIKILSVFSLTVFLAAAIYFLIPEKEKIVITPPTPQEILEKKYAVIKNKFLEAQAKSENKVVFSSWAKNVKEPVLGVRMSDYTGDWSLNSVKCTQTKCSYEFSSIRSTPSKESLEKSFKNVCDSMTYPAENLANCTKTLPSLEKANQVFYRERFNKIYERLSEFSEKISGFKFSLQKAVPIFNVKNINEYSDLMEGDGVYVVYKGGWVISGRLLNMLALMRELEKSEGFIPKELSINTKDKKFEMKGEFYAKD